MQAVTDTRQATNDLEGYMKTGIFSGRTSDQVKQELGKIDADLTSLDQVESGLIKAYFDKLRIKE